MDNPGAGSCANSGVHRNHLAATSVFPNQNRLSGEQSSGNTRVCNRTSGLAVNAEVIRSGQGPAPETGGPDGQGCFVRRINPDRSSRRTTNAGAHADATAPRPPASCPSGRHPRGTPRTVPCRQRYTRPAGPNGGPEMPAPNIPGRSTGGRRRPVPRPTHNVDRHARNLRVVSSVPEAGSGKNRVTSALTGRIWPPPRRCGSLRSIDGHVIRPVQYEPAVTSPGV